MATDRDTGITPLADGFEDAARDDWTALVEKALGGRPIDRALATTTYEGVTVNALYHPDDSASRPDPSTLPGEIPSARGPASLKRALDGWDIQQLHAQPDPAAANAELKADLVGGAQSLALRLDCGARSLCDGSYSEDGVVIRQLADLAAALEGIDLAHTAITLQPGAAALPAAALLLALARQRGVDAAALTGSLGADPIGALAADGTLPGPLEQQFAAMTSLAGWCVANAPGLRTVLIDTDIYHAAGATETQDLAFAMATAVACLRTMTAAGLAIDDACRQIAFTLPVGTDVFQAIAKLRVARRLWARIAEVSGATDRSMRLGAITAARGLSRRDPWVNQLRATCSCFAAGVGGADSVTVRAHTDALGVPGAQARRIARNIQTILVRESSLARVADPAGGSYYVEQLSAEYARRAWALFQEIEAAGGMAEAVLSGRVSGMIETAWQARARNLAHRRDPLTGVSSFPDLDEDPGAVSPPDRDRLEAIVGKARAGNSVVVGTRPDLDALAAAAAAGASLAALASPLRGEAVTIAPLRRRRLGEEFEALRDASDTWRQRTGRRPRALMICLGTPADYTARAVFAKSYLAAGGIEAVETPVAADGVADAWQADAAELAVICSSDTIYSAQAAMAAGALKQAGAPMVLLAGRPAEHEEAWRAAGIDRFVHAGDNTLATLQDLARQIGMIER